MIELLYGCGLRISELIDLKQADFEFEADFLRVTGKGRSSGWCRLEASPNKRFLLILTIQEAAATARRFLPTAPVESFPGPGSGKS